MRIRCIGGGPASLYFAILTKKAAPSTEIEVVERNREGDTFGWGVVFSDETLSHFETADPETYREIRARMAAWTDIDTYVGGEAIRSTGHGFVGLSRKRLLEVFHARCRALGVSLRFETDVADVEAARKGVDLLVAGDGVQSVVRAAYEKRFEPSISWGACRFSWLGTTKPLEAFTFVFEQSEHGLFTVHAYPFEEGLSTWIVECREETWKRAGLDRASEEETVRFVERLFAKRLDGHRILANKSIWRRFPTLRCASWRAGNAVLLGDAAHTAHFSVGSGTKLAMEDAIALSGTLLRSGKDVEAALTAYEKERRPEVERVQRAAEVSRVWFEEAARWMHQDPPTLAFNLMTRSKRITSTTWRCATPRSWRRCARRSPRPRGRRRPRDPPPRPRASSRSAPGASPSRTASSSRRCASTRPWTG